MAGIGNGACHIDFQGVICYNRTCFMTYLV